MSDSLQPHGLYSPWNCPGQNTGVGCSFPSPGDLPNPGIKPGSPALQGDSLPAEPPGKPKKTGMGSLCLLQRIFPTQESNRGLLNCRGILYQLSHQGSPKNCLGYHCNNTHETCELGFPGGSDGNEFTCNAGDLALIPVLGRSPRDGNGYQLQ